MSWAMLSTMTGETFQLLASSSTASMSTTWGDGRGHKTPVTLNSLIRDSSRWEETEQMRIADPTLSVSAPMTSAGGENAGGGGNGMI
jgi:hypothetical protein